MITYVLNSRADVGFWGAENTGSGLELSQVLMYIEPLSLVVARSVAATAVYLLALNFTTCTRSRELKYWNKCVFAAR